MTDDLISRQAAIDALDGKIEITGRTNAEAVKGYVRLVKDRLEQLPSAQRTGRWKVSELPKGKMKYCSECGFGQYIADERQYNFCPNCGAKMDGEVEGRKK